MCVVDRDGGSGGGGRAMVVFDRHGGCDGGIITMVVVKIVMAVQVVYKDDGGDYGEEEKDCDNDNGHYDYLW